MREHVSQRVSEHTIQLEAEHLFVFGGSPRVKHSEQWFWVTSKPPNGAGGAPLVGGDGVPPPYPGCNEIVIIRGFVNCLNPLCEADFMPDVSSASW